MMAKRRKPKLKQHLPDGPTPMFQVVEFLKGQNYWHIKITDATSETDRPEFTCRIPKSGVRRTAHEMAVAGASECAAGRGLIQVTRYQDAIPVEFKGFIGNGRHVFEATPETLENIRRFRAHGPWFKKVNGSICEKVNGGGRHGRDS